MRSVSRAIFMLSFFVFLGEVNAEPRYLNCRVDFHALWNQGKSVVNLTPVGIGLHSSMLTDYKPFELKLPTFGLSFLANSNGIGIHFEIQFEGKRYVFTSSNPSGGMASFPWNGNISLDESDRIFQYRPRDERTAIEFRGLEFWCWISERKEFKTPACDERLAVEHQIVNPN